MPRRIVPLSEGEYYHIYNRGNNREQMFYERANYLFFLRQMEKRLVSVFDIVAYCLMPNHYHLLMQVKQTLHDNVPGKGIPDNGSMASKAMMKLGVSYTKAMNIRYRRVGALFQGPFKAKHVAQDAYLMNLSRYIHRNPVEAGLAAKPEEWEFSSYRQYIGDNGHGWLQPKVILDQFSIVDVYRQYVESYTEEDYLMLAELLFD